MIQKRYKTFFLGVYLFIILILIINIYHFKINTKENTTLRYKDLKLSDYQSNKSQELVVSMNYTPSKIIPFWFWNGNLTKNEITRQIQLMASVGIKEVIIHARIGLEQEYLSEEWFYFVGHALKELKKRDMKVWIYDDIDWPSGRAKDKVLDQDPELIAKNLKRIKIKEKNFTLIQSQEYPVRKIVSVIVPKDNSTRNVKNRYCSDLSCDFSLIEDKITKYIFYQDFSHFETEYSKDKYVDVLNPRTGSKFIEITHEEYYTRFCNYFGNTVVGFFTDEPGFYSSYNYDEEGAIPWTDSFEEIFEGKKEYDMRDYINYIWVDENEISEKIKADYFEVLTERYSKSYFQTLHNWTSSHNTLLTGHLLNEENLYGVVSAEGDLFAHLKYFDVLGTDDIAKFDEKRITPNIASSAKRIYNKPYTLTETFGGYGNNITYDGVKEVTNWLNQNGIDIIVPHAFFYSTERDIQKEDYPPNFFFQNKNLWIHMEDYVKYVNSLVRQTKHNNPVVVIYPIKQAWKKFNPYNSSEIDILDKELKEKINYFQREDIDFIIVPDYIIDKDK